MLKSRCLSCRYLTANGCGSMKCGECPLEKFIPKDGVYVCQCMERGHDEDGACPYYEKWEGEDE